MTDETINDLSLNELFAAWDEKLETMSEDIPLEQSFELYKEGMELLKKCNEKIERVEKQVLIMNEKGELDEF